MDSNISSVVNLIKSLTQNSQDDTDPNNVVLQKFQCPTELNQLGESVKVTKWVAPYKWASGAQAGFTRASITNNYADGSVTLPNVPRFIPTFAPFGKGLLTEESTTNWVLNSDFATIASSTGAIFSDTLHDNTGPWTVAQGAFTYGATLGATGNTANSTDNILVAGNPNWKAMSSTLGGWSVPLQFQIILTTTTAPTGGNDGALYFWIDINNWYRAIISNGTFYLQKDVIGGGATTLASTSFSQQNNQQYCINFSIDPTGLLSTQLYLNNSNGTLLGNLSATDTSLRQGFQFACSGYKGISLAYVNAWGPVPQGWNCNPNGSWSNVVCTGPSITSTGCNSLQLAHDVQNMADTYASSPTVNYGSALANTIWTLTFTAQCSQSGIINLSNTLGPQASGGLNSYLSNCVTLLNFNVANTPQQFTITGTFPSGETATQLFVKLRPPLNSGITISYGGIQLENASYATSHHRNDSTSLTSTRAVEGLSVSTTGFSPSAGTVNMWVNVTANTQRQVSGCNTMLMLIPNAGNYNCLEIFHSGVSANWNVKTTNDAGTAIYGPTFPDLSFGWHMFTLRWSSGACDVLVDGVPVSVVPSPVLSTSFGSTAYFGIYKDGLSYSLDSVIQDITVFNRSLTNAEVLAGFQSNAPLFIDSTIVLKLPLNGSLNVTPITTFNWNQGGIYT